MIALAISRLPTASNIQVTFLNAQWNFRINFSRKGFRIKRRRRRRNRFRSVRALLIWSGDCHLKAVDTKVTKWSLCAPPS